MSQPATATEPTEARTTTVAARLRAVADLIDQHPDELADVGICDDGRRLLRYCTDRTELVATARAIGGKFVKDAEDSTYFFLVQDEIAPGVRLEIYTSRSLVCEKVVTTETVEIEERDPDAVEAALAGIPVVKRTETVEHVEWRCPEALLAGTTPEQVAA